MKRLRRPVLGPGFVIAMTIVLATTGASAAGPERAILQHTDLPPSAAQSATLGTVAMKPGDAIPWHTHPGVEIGYVAAGEMVLSVAGTADRTLHSGQSFIVPRGLAHRSRATGATGARLVVTWVTDTGAALSSPATSSQP